MRSFWRCLAAAFPVAAEIARAFDVELDVIVVRKMGVPGHEELAMGAIASGDVEVRNESVIAGLGISEQQFEAARRHAQDELTGRERSFGKTRNPAVESGRAVIVVIDDGVATGATMRAAVAALRDSTRARSPLPSLSLRPTPRSTRGDRRPRGVPPHPRPFRGGRLLVRRLHPDFRRRGSPAAGTGPRPLSPARRVTPPKTAGRSRLMPDRAVHVLSPA